MDLTETKEFFKSWYTFKRNEYIKTPKNMSNRLKLKFRKFSGRTHFTSEVIIKNLAGLGRKIF